ncbi:TonB-dependent receptor [Mangrovibacterium diazotrophicum]|uniref:TonB-linked SusC/RagA family outer membrane protein n=1 Tax=Mangrovibacterium diazotrophicum TaxID=1261403 RepID=A0A419W629_9BACT|nr:TonB-dependent receptor [Mangrovibacterium diazotrophicum]RKD90896.1 TonB-linked SusC/RagA family outer membrane protein [Mangrovibacterium diazotrophicum]
MKKNVLFEAFTAKKPGRILFLLFICTILSLNVMAQEIKSVTIDNDNISIKELLREVERQSGCAFFYNNSDIDVNKQVSVKVSNQSVENLLREILPDDLTFKVNGKIITILKRGDSSNQENLSKNISVKGTITDGVGDPLPGATIILEGTTIGTISDANGKFNLSNIPGAGRLFVKFIGYNDQLVLVEGRKEINIVLDEEINELDEVVAIGYGTQKKSNVTGAIASVKAEALENRSTGDVGRAIQGKVAGVQIMALSGAPGSGTSFRIRGYSSNGLSNPLFIVDGLKVDNIDFLDPENIGSIEILKDAASGAIYGTEAGNGVVLITTKTGKRGTSRVFYNTQFGIQSMTNKVDMMDADEFKQFWSDAGVSQGAFQSANTDWQNEVFENGETQSHIIGFEGGNDDGLFFASVKYSKNDGMVVGDKDVNKRYIGQLNASYKINDWIKVGTTNSIEHSTTISVSQNAYNSVNSVIGSAYFFDPTVPTFYENDADAPTENGYNLLEAEAAGYNVLRNDKNQLYGTSRFIIEPQNPLGMIHNSDNLKRNSSLGGTLYAELTPFQNFSFTSRLGYGLGSTHTKTYREPYWWSATKYLINPALSESMYQSTYYQWENFANYSFSRGNSEFTTMAGMQYTQNLMEYMSASTDELVSTLPNFHNLDSSFTDANDAIGGSSDKTSNISYFGRLGWSYADRYILQANFRADAYDASRLSKSNRWGYFPSVSAGWVVSNENFMQEKNQDILSYLKIRGSWGINGNVNSLSNYRYTTYVTLASDYYNFNDALIAGSAPSDVLPNEDLTWEESKQYDIGADVRFFSDRLSFSFDYYNKITTNLLTEMTAPAVSGTSSQWVNLGKIKNSGLEFELDWKDRIGKFSYGIQGNISTLHNEVLESPYEEGRYPGGGGFFTEATYFEVGYPIWYLRTNIIDHIDYLTGQPIYKTSEELGTDDGKDYVGSSIPDYTYGITLTAEYKNFDLKVFGSGVQGSKLFWAIARLDQPKGNLPTAITKDHWSMDNIDGVHPAPSLWNNTTSLYYYGSSNDFVFNSSYFKIKQIQLGYTFPRKLISKLKMSSLRAYLSMDNFFTFTKYPGNDPEVMSGLSKGDEPRSSNGMSQGGGMGVDRVRYPAMKQVLFGLNVSF